MEISLCRDRGSFVAEPFSVYIVNTVDDFDDGNFQFHQPGVIERSAAFESSSSYGLAKSVPSAVETSILRNVLSRRHFPVTCDASQNQKHLPTPEQRQIFDWSVCCLEQETGKTCLKLHELKTQQDSLGGNKILTKACSSSTAAMNQHISLEMNTSQPCVTRVYPSEKISFQRNTEPSDVSFPGNASINKTPRMVQFEQNHSNVTSQSWVELDVSTNDDNWKVIQREKIQAGFKNLCSSSVQSGFLTNNLNNVETFSGSSKGRNDIHLCKLSNDERAVSSQLKSPRIEFDVKNSKSKEWNNSTCDSSLKVSSGNSNFINLRSISSKDSNLQNSSVNVSETGNPKNIVKKFSVLEYYLTRDTHSVSRKESEMYSFNQGLNAPLTNNESRDLSEQDIGYLAIKRRKFGETVNASQNLISSVSYFGESPKKCSQHFQDREDIPLHTQSNNKNIEPFELKDPNAVNDVRIFNNPERKNDAHFSFLQGSRDTVNFANKTNVVCKGSSLKNSTVNFYEGSASSMIPHSNSEQFVADSSYLKYYLRSEMPSVPGKKREKIIMDQNDTVEVNEDIRKHQGFLAEQLEQTPLVRPNPDETILESHDYVSSDASSGKSCCNNDERTCRFIQLTKSPIGPDSRLEIHSSNLSVSSARVSSGQKLSILGRNSTRQYQIGKDQDNTSLTGENTGRPPRKEHPLTECVYCVHDKACYNKRRNFNWNSCFCNNSPLGNSTHSNSREKSPEGFRKISEETIVDFKTRGVVQQNIASLNGALNNSFKVNKKIKSVKEENGLRTKNVGLSGDNKSDAISELSKVSNSDNATRKGNSEKLGIKEVAFSDADFKNQHLTRWLEKHFSSCENHLRNGLMYQEQSVTNDTAGKHTKTFCSFVNPPASFNYGLKNVRGNLSADAFVNPEDNSLFSSTFSSSEIFMKKQKAQTEIQSDSTTESNKNPWKENIANIVCKLSFESEKCVLTLNALENSEAIFENKIETDLGGYLDASLRLESELLREFKNGLEITLA